MDDYRDYAMSLVDDGAISERELLLACLKFMTQDEVCQVLEANEISIPDILNPRW
jgi:hypothetical protein